MFRLHYHVSNGGDGSVFVNFHKTSQDAEAADESQPEGWGECSAGHVTLRVNEGVIERRDFRFEGLGKNKNYVSYWTPLEGVSE